MILQLNMGMKGGYMLRYSLKSMAGFIHGCLTDTKLLLSVDAFIFEEHDGFGHSTYQLFDGSSPLVDEFNAYLESLDQADDDKLMLYKAFLYATCIIKLFGLKQITVMQFKEIESYFSELELYKELNDLIRIIFEQKNSNKFHGQ